MSLIHRYIELLEDPQLVEILAILLDNIDTLEKENVKILELISELKKDSEKLNSLLNKDLE